MRRLYLVQTYELNCWCRTVVNFAKKYPLTEQENPLQSPQCKRWQYTLSGWIRLIKCGPDGAELERQIQDRMWEDSEYSTKIRAEFEKWLAEGEKFNEELDDWERASIEDWIKTEEEEDNIRKSKRKSIREGGKYKSRGKEKRREP